MKKVCLYLSMAAIFFSCGDKKKTPEPTPVTKDKVITVEVTTSGITEKDDLVLVMSALNSSSTYISLINNGQTIESNSSIPIAPLLNNGSISIKTGSPGTIFTVATNGMAETSPFSVKVVAIADNIRFDSSIVKIGTEFSQETKSFSVK